MKYVAVVETEIDGASGASTEITPAEVRLMTAELRREAVRNLPRGKYNIMTSETVQSQGSATLEACAEENCVITLGSTIGADYIVRGIISKLRVRFTLSVEMYETVDGNLVASSDPVRSDNIEELVEKAAASCASIYRKFASAQSAVSKPPAAVADTAEEAPEKKAAPKPKPKPREKPRMWLSCGAGAFYAGDYGGGLKWDNGERVTMPLSGGGAYLFLDAVYAEAFAGYRYGGGLWGGTDVPQYVRPDMSRSCLSIGAFAKYPVSAGSVRVFPLIGLDYEAAVSGTLRVNGLEFPLYAASALSALWFRIGAGAEADLNSAVYIRAEALYGARPANGFERGQAQADRNGAKTGNAVGVTVKAAAGIRL
jgi:hypothetical protein